MILAKSCHDLDILQWLLDERCTRLHSFGSLSYFRRENMPEGAPEYCVQGCPAGDTCIYNARRIYQQRQAPAFVKTATKRLNPTDEEILDTITHTDYGKCVFRCDNDVVDHQVVNLEYEDGATVSFTMSAFNRGGRKLRIMGTKGEVTAEMSDEFISLFDFDSRKTERIRIADAILDESITGGHGGGDRGIFRAFIRLLNGTYEGDTVSDIAVSIENHLVAFAAEESRLTGKVVDMAEYTETFRSAVNRQA